MHICEESEGKLTSTAHTNFNVQNLIVFAKNPWVGSQVFTSMLYELTFNITERMWYMHAEASSHT